MERKTLITVLCLVIAVMQIVAVTTSYWSCDQSNTFHMGLWKACASEMCVDIPVDGDNSYPVIPLNFARGLSILGCTSIILFLLFHLSGKGKSLHIPLLVLGGMSSLISCLIWYTTLRSQAPYGVVPKGDLHLGYSFYLNMVAGLLVVPAVIFH